MSRQDWYRQTEWSGARAAAFAERLARSRSASHRAQYLRIQALSLAETGTSENLAYALTLLEQIFLQYPEEFDAPLAHLQAAHCHDALGNINEAIRHFEAAVEARLTRPNVDTGVALEYPWFIARNALVERYAQALELLAGACVVFPHQRFRECASRALIAAQHGEHAAARASACAALEAANVQRSAFQRHPGVGLVGASDRAWIDRLAKLTSALDSFREELIVQIRLRPATDDDHAFLYALHRVTMRAAIEATWGWDEAWQQTDFERRVAGYEVAVVESEGMALAAQFTEWLPDCLYVHELQVLPAYQGRGIGSELLRAIIGRAADAGVPVRLSVLQVNPSARRLYERLGFVVTGHEPPFVRMRHDLLVRGTVFRPTTPVDERAAARTDDPSDA